jgi:SAM-dependent methyltransferase
VSFAQGVRSRLTTHDLGRFAGNTLFDRIGRVVCGVGRLPRKELYEAWEVARRVRRWCRGGRVLDVAGGHGLLAHIMLLLDDSSPDAVVVDPSPPPSSAALHDAFVVEWPRLHRRVTFVRGDIRPFPIRATDVVVSSHACGTLTDAVLDAAVAASARVAVLPCCHDLAECDAGPLTGWLDGPLAIDAMRAVSLAHRGYRVRTQTIPGAITPKNRLLIGVPN